MKYFTWGYICPVCAITYYPLSYGQIKKMGRYKSLAKREKCHQRLRDKFRDNT
jgi:hypothetical protein